MGGGKKKKSFQLTRPTREDFARLLVAVLMLTKINKG